MALSADCLHAHGFAERLQTKSMANMGISSARAGPWSRINVMSILIRMAKGILFSFRKCIHSTPVNSRCA